MKIYERSEEMGALIGACLMGIVVGFAYGYGIGKWGL